MKAFLLAALTSILHATPTFAASSSLVGVKGTVANFNDKFVELIVKTGTKIRVPRSQIPESKDLRPNMPIEVMVQLDDIKLAPAQKK